MDVFWSGYCISAPEMSTKPASPRFRVVQSGFLNTANRVLRKICNKRSQKGKEKGLSLILIVPFSHYWITASSSMTWWGFTASCAILILNSRWMEWLLVVNIKKFNINDTCQPKNFEWIHGFWESDSTQHYYRDLAHARARLFRYSLSVTNFAWPISLRNGAQSGSHRHAKHQFAAAAAPRYTEARLYGPRV